MLSPAFVSLPDMIAGHGRQRGGRTALAWGDQSWDWRTFAGLSAIWSERIIAGGVERGDRVALLSANRPEAYVAVFAALSAGAVATPISPLLTPAQIASILRDSGAKVLFVDPYLAALAEAAMTLAPLDKVIALSEIAPQATYPNWAKLPHLETGDAATLIYSSGTTGEPKGILHDHGARIMHAIGLAAEFGIDERAVTLLATPLHTNGTWMMALPTIAAGGAIRLLDRFSADAGASLLAEKGVTHMFAVPLMLGALRSELDARPRSFPDLVMCVSAGSALAPELKRAAFEFLGGRLGELYGLTEGVATLLKPHDVLAHLESVGRAGGGIDIVILDDAGAILPPGEIGEIAGRSSGMMRGYFNKPVETDALVWRDPRGRIFIRTGDMGHLDAEGYLHITDRKRDMIVTGGLNVFSADLEAAVRRHPAVADVAVIAAEHEKWGETPLAIVRLKAPADAADIAAFANEGLAKHQRLSGVIVHDEDFPRNLLGKVLKRALRDQYGRRS